MKNFSKKDTRFMRRAVLLARRGQGQTSPNPCVGAVLVRGDRLLGEGWHHAAGQPHAEIEAIADARRRGVRRLKGATLYVTLEPCCTTGRTPPCTQAVLDAGLGRVVAGMVDPNPRHAGRGLRLLRRRGVRVEHGLCGEECAALNEDWIHWMTQGTPWVAAKCGMTLDGKIATARGESRWITGAAARGKSQELRRVSDAILVGVNTVLQDDPRLDFRGRGPSRQPLRVVLDARGQTPLDARLVRGEGGGSCWIFVGRGASGTKLRALRVAGARVTRVRTRGGRLDLGAVLRALGRTGVVRLVVEGGGEVLGSFFRERRVQEIFFFIAPRVLGGTRAVRAVAGEGFAPWKDSAAIRGLTLRRVGEDLLAHGWIEVQGSRFNGSRVDLPSHSERDKRVRHAPSMAAIRRENA